MTFGGLGAQVKEFFAYHLRFRSRQFAVLWFSDEPDGVLLGPEGKLLVFASAAELYSYAQAHGFEPSIDEGATLDLDSVADWCAHPSAETLSCVALLDAWNFFGDVQASAGSAGSAFVGNRDEYDWLNARLFHGCNLPAVTPPGERFDPVWSAPDVEAMSKVLRSGLVDLER